MAAAGKSRNVPRAAPGAGDTPRPRPGKAELLRQTQEKHRAARKKMLEAALAENAVAVEAMRRFRGRLVDLDKVVEDYGLTRSALAESLGFADETLQRAERLKAPKTQMRLREMLDILARVEPWAGGKLQAMSWYRAQGIAALGDQTAEALVRQNEAAIVRAYLDALAAGGYA